MDALSTGRTRNIKFQTPSGSISVDQHGKNTVVLLEPTEQHNKSHFSLKMPRVRVTRNEAPQLRAREKQIFQLFNKAAPFSALKWIWLKEKLHCQKKM